MTKRKTIYTTFYLDAVSKISMDLYDIYKLTPKEVLMLKFDVMLSKSMWPPQEHQCRRIECYIGNCHCTEPIY